MTEIKLSEQREQPIDINQLVDCFLEVEEIKKEMKEMPEGVKCQIENYIKSIIEVSKQRNFEEEESIARKIAFLKFKLWQFIDSRDKRIEELKSPEVLKAEEIKNEIYPDGRPFTVCCVDGRVLSKEVAGLTGYVTRTPAGDIFDVIKITNNGKPSFYLKDGQFSKLLDEQFKNHNTVVEMFDSHLDCGASGADYAHNYCSKELTQITNKDELEKIHAKALVKDVKRKKEIVEATTNYVKDNYGEKKRIINIQYSYDPTTGYSYMGLEKDECLEKEEVKQNGYSKEILSQLAKEGKIISAEDIANKFVNIFQNNYFDINYQTDYVNSILLFWKNIKKMKEYLVPKIIEEIKGIFPDINNEKEIEHRALFLLRNAYSGYLHSHNVNGDKKECLRDEHKESVIVETFSEKGPFDRAIAFSTNPNAPDGDLNIAFMAGLIRNNRIAGRDSDSAKQAREVLFNKKNDEYIKTAVPVMFFQRLEGNRNNKIEDLQDVKELQAIDWSDLAGKIDWYGMNRKEFLAYINEKFNLVSGEKKISADAFEKIEALRQKAIKLFDINNPLNRDVMKTGNIIPVFTLAGPNRETIALFPFLMESYKMGKGK